MLADVRLQGLTQAEVAKAIGITQGTISKIERGVTKELRSSAFQRLQKLHRSKVAQLEEQIARGTTFSEEAVNG